MLNVREHIFIACQGRVTISVLGLQHEAIIFIAAEVADTSS